MCQLSVYLVRLPSCCWFLILVEDIKQCLQSLGNTVPECTRFSPLEALESNPNMQKQVNDQFSSW